MNNYMNDYSSAAQAVWAAPTLEQKKSILNEMVDMFAAKGKDGANLIKFRRSIDSITNTRRADEMASNLALNVGNAVIK